MRNKLMLVRIDGHTYVQDSNDVGNYTIHDTQDGEQVCDLGNVTISPVKGAPVVSYKGGDSDAFWNAFERLIRAADKLALKYAGALGHTVVVIGTSARGERHARVESCDLERSLAEARDDETVYQRTAKGWRRANRRKGYA